MRTIMLLAALAACSKEEAPVQTPTPVGEYGPDNGWYHAMEDEVPAAPAAARFAVGQPSPEILLPDQYGDTVSSYQFAGNLLLVDVFGDDGEEWEEPVEGACTG